MTAVAERKAVAVGSASRERGRRPRVRKPRGHGRLLAASVLMLLGAFLPWLYTPLGTFTGMNGPGLWTATVAMLALAGALVPIRLLAVVQAVIAGGVAMVIPLWQFWHLYSQVGMAGWMPGPGLLLTFVGGILCAVAAWQLLHPQASSA